MKAQHIAYNHLKRLIMSGELPANSAISPEGVGRTIGVSRMPVREALLKLQSEGLVTIGINRRPFVTARTQNEIAELFEIRVALESLAIERAVPRMTPALLDQLAKQLGRMKAAENNPKQWIVRHDEFHDAIYAASDMPRLMDEIRRMRNAVQPYIATYINAHDSPEIAGAEHKAIVDALERQDALIARNVLAQHIRDCAAAVIYFLLSGQSRTPAKPRAEVPLPASDEVE